MKDLMILHKWLVLKLDKYNLEKYNDSTYSWSRGYQQALRDIKEFIEQIISNK
jgi:hypothetical protein